MNFIIKILLNFFDHFTQKKILDTFKRELNVKEPIVVIDVGSHKGEYISSLIQNFLIEKIYSFEPNIEIFKILEKNFKNNHKIIINNCGISQKEGFINFYKNIESSSSTINKLNEESKYFKKKYFLLNFLNLKKISEKIKIKVIRLENYLEKEKIKKIQILKIDTEGYEYQVLKSLGERIKNIKLIHFEHHYDDMILKEYKFQDIHNFLHLNGFIKIFKIKMKFRKSFEYIYKNKKF